MRTRLSIGFRSLAVVMACLVSGCQPQASQKSDANLQLEISPQPPQVGPAAVTLMLSDASGEPLTMADVKLEGNMNHAGMRPVFSDLEETAPGRYEGTLDFTMGGDWFVLVSGQLADGSRLDEKIDVPGVVSK